MPGPVAVYAVYSAAVDTSALTTPVLSPTPVNGDVLVVKLTTWDTGNASGASSGGGQTYNVTNTAAPVGFNGYSRVDTCTISGSPGAFSVTSGGTAAPSRHGMVVEHYRAADGFFLAGSPAINAVKNGAGFPSAGITTVGTGSVLSWCSVDVSSVDPATRTPLLSAVETGLGDFHVGANSVQYSYYAVVGAPGPYTIGMSAPGGQTWVMTGVEIQFVAPSSGNPVTVHAPRRRRRTRHPVLIVTGEGAPPAPPSPADVQWCAGPATINWHAGEVTTNWVASEPTTNWQASTPEEDC
jgi:hypothetical protein